MSNGATNYCCDRFRKDVEEGTIISVPTDNGMRWVHRQWWRLEYCPYCGSDLTGKGPNPHKVAASGNAPSTIPRTGGTGRPNANPKKKDGPNKPLRKAILVLISVVLPIGLFLCSRLQSWHSPLSPFKVTDSQARTSDKGPAGLYWLDNNRVLFLTGESLDPNESRQRYAVWDTSAGPVNATVLRDFHGRVECVRDGKVLYSVWEESTAKATYHFGAPGNAPEYPPPGDDMRIDGRFDCDWIPKKMAYPDGWKNDMQYRYKLRGDNQIEVLEINGHYSPGKMVYHERNDDKGVFFPPEVPLGSIRYNPFLNVYYAPAADGYWVMDRKGAVRKQAYSQKVLAKDVYGLYPSKNGYVVHIRWPDFGRRSDAGQAGLYLMQGEKYRRLIGGHVGSVSISPDGCKVAFEHARNLNEYSSRKRPFRTLKMIDLCSKPAR